MKNFVFFDLDHTLLDGDSDVLWIEFLLAEGWSTNPTLGEQNKEVARRYKAATIDPQEFTDFYVGTLVGRSPEAWEPIRQHFYDSLIAPKVSAAAKAIVAQHQSAGHTVVLTSATNTFLTELTAKGLGISHLLGSVPERVDGQFTGTTTGTLNMRAGKVVRIKAWLADQGLRLEDLNSYAYSDSMNDLPLLEAVNHAVVVHPDAQLASIAQQRGWPSLSLY